MRTWPLGSRIFVIGNVNNHNYIVGRAYIVAEIDDEELVGAPQAHEDREPGRDEEQGRPHRRASWPRRRPGRKARGAPPRGRR